MLAAVAVGVAGPDTWERSGGQLSLGLIQAAPSILEIMSP